MEGGKKSTVGLGGWLQVHDYVTHGRARAWETRMLSDQDQWVSQRLSQKTRFTYGRAWYNEIESGHLGRYHARAMEANALVRRLAGLVEAMKDSARFLEGPGGVTDLPTRARHENLGPYWCETGVHIFGGTEGEFPSGVPHTDYEGLAPYVPALFDAQTRAFSVVLAIAVPERGGGLDVFPQRRVLANELPSKAERETWKPIQLDYRAGTLSIIDSFLYHCIQEFRAGANGLWRMSAVMHFLFRQEPYPHWEYWF